MSSVFGARRVCWTTACHDPCKQSSHEQFESKVGACIDDCIFVYNRLQLSNFKHFM